ncbi:hypothetical protein C8J56DRAFT_900069 [Mycena floridula]|nr:hypothetical protein C8J56DRAFT_900069 [Mycena floridula]
MGYEVKMDVVDYSTVSNFEGGPGTFDQVGWIEAVLRRQDMHQINSFCGMYTFPMMNAYLRVRRHTRHRDSESHCEKNSCYRRRNMVQYFLQNWSESNLLPFVFASSTKVFPSGPSPLLSRDRSFTTGIIKLWHLLERYPLPDCLPVVVKCIHPDVLLRYFDIPPAGCSMLSRETWQEQQDCSKYGDLHAVQATLRPENPGLLARLLLPSLCGIPLIALGFTTKSNSLQYSNALPPMQPYSTTRNDQDNQSGDDMVVWRTNGLVTAKRQDRQQEYQHYILCHIRREFSTIATLAQRWEGIQFKAIESALLRQLRSV